MRVAENLLSGRNDFLSVLLRVVLFPLQLLYVLAASTKNALYDSGLIEPGKAEIPVISVGNLTVGGTGKTPLVIALARRGMERGKKVAVVTRGYGAVATDDGLGDEAALIAERAPGVELIVTTNKLAGAVEAAERGCDVALIDDGMQHRRLHRDMDIVCVDARAPMGNGEVLPCGPLREPAAGLGRADVIVMSHSEMLNDEELRAREAALGAYRRGVPVLTAVHAPRGVRAVTGGEEQPAASLAGRELHLFCGLASPASFRHTVEALGARVTGMTVFPDHHAFTAACVAQVRSEAGTSELLCTEKDAAKIARIPGNEDVLCLSIDLELQGELPPLPGFGD